MEMSALTWRHPWPASAHVEIRWTLCPAHAAPRVGASVGTGPDPRSWIRDSEAALLPRFSSAVRSRAHTPPPVPPSARVGPGPPTPHDRRRFPRRGAPPRVRVSKSSRPGCLGGNPRDQPNRSEAPVTETTGNCLFRLRF